MCSTGPPMVTATVRSETLKRNLQLEGYINFTIRVLRTDFSDHGGIFKVDVERNFGADGEHYMKHMQKHNVAILSSFTALNISEIEGLPVTLNEKRIYKVENGSLHAFPDFDTFHAHGFQAHHVLVLNNQEFNSIPEGGALSPLDYTEVEES